ncbi:hydroxyacylglutathione hydrolase [Yoonia sp.]|uniref:hydroxyacylglutathione hydrolase n=1 Tax=Yoonia sp. TaxID=2212373 RepID=UPI0025F91EC6|nr:hydroxyacylglutathione hydrolase [Yoonia sp.]
MPNEQPDITLVTVPCLSDNYAFLVHNDATGQTALIDAPEAQPIKDALHARGWTLTDILITHHHGDHIDAVAALRDGARVIGAAVDAHRLPPLDLEVAAGDVIDICGLPTHVLDVSGHTVGHIAYHMPNAKLAFTADSLMALGCGRLFEGTPAKMWVSMKKLRALPADTMICSGHEYTENNARFALSLDPANAALISRSEGIKAARAAGRPTVPSTLDEEMRTNPFLRADDPTLKAVLRMADASDADVFAEIRARKDKF